MGCPGSTLKNETYADFVVGVVSLFLHLGDKIGTNGRFTKQMDK